jgi:ribose transport system substrate-binding protein
MKQSHPLMVRRLFALSVAGLLALTACGGSDTASDTTAAATDSSAADIAAARVTKYLQTITEIDLGEAPASVPEAKTVYYIACSVAVCAEIQVGVEAAVKALGWTFKSTSHQDTPETVAAAFDAAIAAKPDVVMSSGNPREWFADQLATLQEMNIPVISWSLPEGYEPGNGIAANVLSADDYYFYGVLMADYAVANSPNKNIRFVGLPVFPVLSLVQQGFNDEIAAICPDCKVETQEIAISDIGVNLPGQIVSALQADPTLDFIVYAFGGMMYGVPDALDAAGLIDQAKAVSQAGGPMNFDFIAKGRHQLGEVALASELLGWRVTDMAVSLLSGGTISKAPATESIAGRADIGLNGLPLQILQADTIADPTALWPGVVGFQDKFLARWGK